MPVTIETKGGETLCYYLARAGGKNFLSLVLYCRELGMTDDEIQELFEKAFNNMEG